MSVCVSEQERDLILINPSSGTQSTIKAAEPPFSGDDPGTTWVMASIDLRNKPQLVDFGVRRSECGTDAGEVRKGQKVRFWDGGRGLTFSRVGMDKWNDPREGNVQGQNLMALGAFAGRQKKAED